MKRALAIVSVAALVLAGAALATKPGSGSSLGTGRVFFPNPVATLQDQTLTDQKDADYPALRAAYRIVTLTNLDGSGYLRRGLGQRRRARRVSPPIRTTNTFLYGRSDDRFEQVMAYYWVTEAQKYIQSLGFGSRRCVRSTRSRRTSGSTSTAVDNSFSWDKHDVLRFGKGGVDDAEDAEVILHEYGHAIQDAQVVRVRRSTRGGRDRRGLRRLLGRHGLERHRPDARPAVRRRLGLGLVHVDHAALPAARRYGPALPGGPEREVHHDGQIWSRALWDIRNALGHIKADTIILEAQFGMPDPTMPELAQNTVNTALRLYGNATANTVLAAFQARGILP